jgi:hypothetical protein
MANLNLSAVGESAKRLAIYAIKTTGDTAQALVQATADLLVVVAEGVTHVTLTVQKSVVQIVKGAISGAADMGEDVFLTTKSAVRGSVKGASEVGADVGKIAVTATEEAIKAAEEVGADTSKATRAAITGAIEAANEIGGEAAKTVRDALIKSIKGAKDVIKEVMH